MKKNLGSVDQLIRLIIAIVIGVLYYQEIITGTFAKVLSVFALILLITSFVRFCPIYALLGLNSSSTNTKK
jgi:hypothetical protein